MTAVPASLEDGQAAVRAFDPSIRYWPQRTPHLGSGAAHRPRPGEPARGLDRHRVHGGVAVAFVGLPAGVRRLSTRARPARVRAPAQRSSDRRVPSSTSTRSSRCRPARPGWAGPGRGCASRAAVGGLRGTGSAGCRPARRAPHGRGRGRRHGLRHAGERPHRPGLRRLPPGNGAQAEHRPGPCVRSDEQAGSAGVSAEPTALRRPCPLPPFDPSFGTSRTTAATRAGERRRRTTSCCPVHARVGWRRRS